MVILFFDGECGLCNRSVVRFLRWEREQCQVHFAPLQGEAARTRLSPKQVEAPYPSLLVWDGNTAHARAAGLKILARELRNPLGFLARFGLAVIPDNWTNGLYDIVARNRHRASNYSCALHLDSTVKGRFLD